MGQLLSFPEEDSPAIAQLKQDWIQDNSDAREEDVTRKQLETRIKEAEMAAAGFTDPTKFLDLAEAYGLLAPKDVRCLDACEMAMKYSLPFLSRQRQGDANQLYGRCLFLANRFEESLRVLLRAKECYKDEGTRKLRRANNVALLRAYAALGNGEKASRRLEVALSQCEKQDDAILLYVNGKAALEDNGLVDSFENIWEEHLDANPVVKAQFEQYMGGSADMLKQLNSQGKGQPKDQSTGELSFKEIIRWAREHKSIAAFIVVAIIAYIVLAVYISWYLAMVLLPRYMKQAR